MKKYRVKLSDQRVFGPFTYEQVCDLFKKAKIDEQAKCQTFPVGEWKLISEFKEFQNIDQDLSKTDLELRDENGDENDTQATIVHRPPEVPEIEKLKPQTEEIGETIVADFAPKNEEKDDSLGFEVEEHEFGFEGVIEEPEDDLSEDLEKTRVIRKVNDGELEKTVIRKIDVEYDEDQIEEVEKSEPALTLNEVKEIVVSADDETQMFDMKGPDDNLPMLQKRKLEFEYKELENEIQKDERELSKKNKDIESLEDEEDDEEGGDKKKKSMFVIIFCVFLLFYLDDDDKKIEVKKIVKPNIAFPLEVSNTPSKAEKFLEEGKVEYQKGDYYSKVKASTLFFQSLQNGFLNNPAMSYLVLVYGEILPMTKDVQSSARIQYKLLSLTKSKLYNDWKIALGAALFYYHMDKKTTARTILENYTRLSKNNARILSLYLKILVEQGEEEFAKKVYESLKQARKSIEVIDALATYHRMNKDLDSALELYKDNYDIYKNSMEYLANYGELLVDMGNLKDLKKVAEVLVALRGEGSPRLFAKGLKFAGFVNAGVGLIDKASQLFASSLSHYPDSELKDTLASLNLGGGDLSEQLIKYSKIDQLIRESKERVKEAKWNEAFLLALDAVDLNSKSKKAKIYLSELQSKRGYIKEAIETLKGLNDLYPKDPEVSHAYLMSLIRGYQFKDVNEYLSALHAENNLKSRDLFYEILGEYFYRRGKSKVAVRHYREALKLNPIEDKYFYKLAKISCDQNMFKQCRSYINEARDLDPINVEYKSIYAKVLFEIEGIDVAVGYLLRELEENPNDPRIVGKIAMLYYQNQSYKQYREYKEKLEDLPVKDESLYRYLIETSLIDGNDDLVIEASEKLLLVNPGDIDTKMTLSRTYAKKGEIKKALSLIESVAEQMPTYPKIYYEKAVILLGQNDIEGAIEAAKKEVEISKSEFGYYILGKALIEKREYADAQKAFELANARNPDFFENLLELGWLKYRERDFATARELYLRAAKFRPNSPLLAKRLGDVFKEIGQSTLAVEQYKKYLKLRPTAQDRNIIESIINQLQ